MTKTDSSPLCPSYINKSFGLLTVYSPSQSNPVRRLLMHSECVSAKLKIWSSNSFMNTGIFPFCKILKPENINSCLLIGIIIIKVTFLTQKVNK